MVTERYYPIWGGAENQLRQLAPHLVDNGCTVTVLTRRWKATSPKRDIDGKTKIIRLGVSGDNTISTAIFIISLIIFVIFNRRQIDILHSHGAVKMGALCSLLARVLRLKNVVKIATAGHIPLLCNTVVGRIMLMLFKSSDVIIAMTKEIVDELKAINMDKKRMFIITNGVDCTRFSPLKSKDKTDLRTRNGIRKDSIVMLFSGRIVHRKGLDVLLRAWHQIYQHQHNIHLLILGSGKTQKDSVEEDCVNYVELKQLENITFVGETVFPEKFLNMADIFVFPSRIEGFPNALMEAMASGLVVVSSNIGGVQSLIRDRLNGVLFISGDSNDLADKLIEVMDPLESSRELGREAREYMKVNYAFEKIAGEYVALYQNVLSNNN